MKIIVDAFGGDNAPQQILLGCAQARESLGIDIVLAGDKARLEACAKELDLTQQLAKMEIARPINRHVGFSHSMLFRCRALIIIC